MMQAAADVSATIIINHNDPALGRSWGYQIGRGVTVVRICGRWLVSADTYAFLAGSA